MASMISFNVGTEMGVNKILVQLSRVRMTGIGPNAVHTGGPLVVCPISGAEGSGQLIFVPKLALCISNFAACTIAIVIITLCARAWPSANPKCNFNLTVGATQQI